MLYELEGYKPQLSGDNIFIAPDAAVIGRCNLAEYSSVWFKTVIRGDNETITVGRGTNIQDASVLHTDDGVPLTIGSGVTVGHKVMLHGCKIDDESLIGMGATILNGAKVGKNCLVGANSLITEGKNFPDGCLIVGSPASVRRELTDQEIALIKYSASHYIKNAGRYINSLKPL